MGRSVGDLGLLVVVADDDDARVVILVIDDARRDSGRCVTMSHSNDGLDVRSGGSTAVVGDVGDKVALAQEQPGSEVRLIPIVADHCVAGLRGLLVEMTNDEDVRVVALVIDDAGRVSGR